MKSETRQHKGNMQATTAFTSVHNKTPESETGMIKIGLMIFKTKCMQWIFEQNHQ
jgi:hypothetical protein